MAGTTLWNNAELHVCWKESGMLDMGYALRFMNMADPEAEAVYLNRGEALELAKSINDFFKLPEGEIK
jgi:hypothetical protein